MEDISIHERHSPLKSQPLFMAFLRPACLGLGHLGNRLNFHPHVSFTFHWKIKHQSIKLPLYESAGLTSTRIVSITTFLCYSDLRRYPAVLASASLSVRPRFAAFMPYTTDQTNAASTFNIASKSHENLVANGGRGKSSQVNLDRESQPSAHEQPSTIDWHALITRMPCC